MMGPKSEPAGDFFAEDEGLGEPTDVRVEDVGTGLVSGADRAAAG